MQMKATIAAKKAAAELAAAAMVGAAPAAAEARANAGPGAGAPVVEAVAATSAPPVAAATSTTAPPSAVDTSSVGASAIATLPSTSISAASSAVGGAAASEEVASGDPENENIAGVILPDFWNIRLERPLRPVRLGGYDVIYIDASRAGSFCSRMSHSCDPNCASCCVVIDGRHSIALRALRDIGELFFIFMLLND